MTSPDTTTSATPTGAQLRDAGVVDVLAADAAVHRGYRTAIEQALNELILLSLPFTADDLREYLGPDFQPHSPNLLPAVIHAYSAAGRIHGVGWTRSTRPSRHAGVIRTWVGAAVDTGPDAA